MVRNPFPQLAKVAVVPFINHSAEPAADGRQFALAYAGELQSIPGFEVVPISVVEPVLREYRIELTGIADARKLAQILEVDAVVIGAITDYTPFYPPRCTLHVEWVAANPCFHPIPPGYGLPWGTPEEEEIPSSLVYEAEMALAKSQLKTQTPGYEVQLEPPPEDEIGDGDNLDGSSEEIQEQGPSPFVPDEAKGEETSRDGALERPGSRPKTARGRSSGAKSRKRAGGKPNVKVHGSAKLIAERELSGSERNSKLASHDSTDKLQPIGATGTSGEFPGLPENWPDPRGFTPRLPSAECATCEPSEFPVLSHTRTYRGNDADFTSALSTYVYHRDEARHGGWQSYLQRGEDFIRFCCHLHIAEMLTARGGAGESRVVWRWPTDR